MKALKLIVGALVAVLLVAALVVFLGLQNINQIVKEAVETVGPDVLGTSVKLNQVDIKITEGRGELAGLSIANPKGFSSNNAFELGKIVLKVDPASVTGDVIVIDEILISGAKLLAEQKGLTETNLQALLDNVKKPAGGKSSSATQGDAGSGSDVKLAVKKFTFNDSDIEVVTQEWGDRKIRLPAIAVTDIGSPEKGLTPDQLAEAMIQPVLRAAQTSVKRDLEKLAKEKLEEKAREKLKEKFGDKLDDEKVEQFNQLKSLFGK